MNDILNVTAKPIRNHAYHVKLNIHRAEENNNNNKMIYKEEFKNKKFKCIEFEQEQCSLKLRSDQIKKFNDDDERLSEKIRIAKLKYDSENKIKSSLSYEKFETMCQISVSTLRKTINGNLKPTRNFLYKFTIGLKMSLDEANEFFKLCGGVLTEDCKADCIAIGAIKDGDDIYSFIDEYEQIIGKKIGIKER